MRDTSTKTEPDTLPDMGGGAGLVPGDVIGRYQLTSLLASGGMGQVWAARPVGSGFARTVALKLVRAEMSGDENYARMFIDEATVASSIHHPNVCETYELGKHGDRLFMAMEWVAGDSLAGLLRKGDALIALDPRIAARIIADACAGLHAAHETVGPDGSPLGVVHRDISPPNILVSSQGQSKVSDFGIAKARHQLHERTRTGEVKGKFAYIPPEQLSGTLVDRRADVYAMGCVLYVATLGSRPFGNGGEAIRKILLNAYKAPHLLRPDYPPELEEIIVKALAPKPEDRFQTAEDMQIALEEWLMRSGKLVTASDVAKCVRERINPEVRARNEALMSQHRVMPTELMLKLTGDVDSETPTAGSGLVTAPPELWRGRALPAEARPSETTKVAPTVASPSAQAQGLAPRPSDATALVDFVPVGAPTAPPSRPTGEATEETAAVLAAMRPGAAWGRWLPWALAALVVLVVLVVLLRS